MDEDLVRGGRYLQTERKLGQRKGDDDVAECFEPAEHVVVALRERGITHPARFVYARVVTSTPARCLTDDIG
jgi:hypothetical protein